MGDWTYYSEKKPPSACVYEWRIPSKGTPGIVIIFAAHMRSRGAGFETVVSPAFDYWDGYRLHVPADVQWRETSDHADLKWHSQRIVSVEGLDIAPCPYCGTVPSFKTAGPGYYFGAYPHNVSLWRFECCAWASTPWMDDPRKIEDRRREAFAKAFGADVVADAYRWRRHLQFRDSGGSHSHHCIRCGHGYTPVPTESEDCPVCGCDGTDGEADHG